MSFFQFVTCLYKIRTSRKDNVHPYHIHRGNWVRVHRGIYRLAKFPQSQRPDLIIWALWSCNSHQTALSIHELSDIMPDKLHMTVPLSFRRNSKAPKILALHHKNLSQDRVTFIDGYLVTTPYQTLLDVIEQAEISHELIFQTVKTASDQGIMTQSLCKRLLSEPSLKQSPIYPYLTDL